MNHEPQNDHDNDDDDEEVIQLKSFNSFFVTIII